MSIFNGNTTVDVICFTNTYNHDIYKMTVRTITSLHDSENDVEFSVTIFESNNESLFDYSNISSNLVKIPIVFNYNRYLNIFNQLIKNDWILITNNDVKYERKWFSKILEVNHNNPSIESFSPKCPIFYSTVFGDHFMGDKNKDYWLNYKVSEGLMGWSLIMKKRVWDIVYPWDEQFDFYHQDNDYAEIIKKNGIKHALVRDSIATHLGSIKYFTGENNTEELKLKMKESDIKFKNKYNL